MPLDQPESEYPYEKSMGFFDHLDDLRKHLIRMALGIIVGVVICFIYVTEIFDNIITAPLNKNFLGYEWYCRFGRWVTNTDALCFVPPKFDFQNNQLQTEFLSAFKIALVGGIIIAFPFIIWQLWRFVKPALSTKEVKRVQRSLIWVSILFFSGVFFSYFLLLPLMINFLGNFKLSEMHNVNNLYAINGVVGFISFLSLATGLIFELPVLIYILAKIGLISSSFLKKNWRYAVLIIFILAGIATPSPDVFSQLILGLPLIALYFGGYYLAIRVEKQREKDLIAE